VKWLGCAAPVAAWAFVVVGCSRADVHPVTRESPAASNGGGSGGAGGTSGGGTQGGDDIGGSIGGGGAQSAACASRSARPGDSERTVLVDGKTRSYLLHVPSTYDGSMQVPLVVDFHGIGESGDSERSSSPYPGELDPEAVVMAFPDGVRGPAGSAWNVGPCCVTDVDDVAFARALVADVQADACIDPRRVYAVGTLTGGGMAHYVACHAADVFAAVAPSAFDLLEENVDDCQPSQPITVISFRGTEDTRVPYAGGPSTLVPGMPLTFLGALDTFESWGAINRCVGPASAPDANGCTAYSGCADGAEVILCSEQGGREGPGDPSIAWPVLKRHQL
jgi:polyhydroxybutyrate depolymerase